MRQETRERVLRVIAELGYRPSSVARSLISKRTHTAGLLISDVGNPFYSEVIHGVEDVAHTQGYDIFLCNTSYDLARGTKSIQSLIDKRVDGVLFMSSSMSAEWVHELAERQVPSVVLDWEIAGVEQVAGTITLDFEMGIRAAVAHLLELGHRRLAHVSGPADLWTANVRRDAFFDALCAKNVDPAQVRVIEGNLRITGGRQALAALLSEPCPPTAIFAANDLMALGVVWEARSRGLRVPEDLSVVGLDDIELAAQITPPLTTVALPRYEIGNLAMQMLLELLQSSGEPDATIPRPHQQVATRLLIRHSTAPPPTTDLRTLRSG
jgi:LacI family transcriptional regulator